MRDWRKAVLLLTAVASCESTPLPGGGGVDGGWHPAAGPTGTDGGLARAALLALDPKVLAFPATGVVKYSNGPVLTLSNQGESRAQKISFSLNLGPHFVFLTTDCGETLD